MSSSPGALLLLLLAVYLLLAFFTGRLEWLFSMASDVSAGYRAAPTPAAPSQGAPPSTAWQPRYMPHAG